ncbi:GntR family transcriptional regulator [uncultured Amnibacterium sp.]|uniref:GntR family transcriptional regulator n=1 Tax=uncultured Amnibacterium sp. TaxID=1631851 RepID=UPI0035C9C3FA
MQILYDMLRDRILTGTLEPGSVLSQVQLARQFGVSRTPLREALRRLLAEHLVSGDFNRRMRVSELNLDDLDQIYAMRIALEPLGVASTLARITPAQQAALSDSVDRMQEAIDRLDLEMFRREHRTFHLGLTAGAGTRLHAALGDLWDHSERYRLAYLQHDYGEPDSASADRLRTSQSEHRRILDAALTGDAAACSLALVAHLRRTVDVVFRESTLVPRPRVVGFAVAARAGE